MRTNISIVEMANVYPVSADTLLLADNIEVRTGEKVLEVGCGTGYISIIAAMDGGDVEGIDINPAAIELSERNARKNNLPNIRFHLSDLFEKVATRYDVIIFNPPYLPSEEFETNTFDKCWDGGEGGREVTERFLDRVLEHLNPHGRVYLLQSSISGHERSLERLRDMGMVTKVIASKRLFFEELFVIRAMRTG